MSSRELVGAELLARQEVGWSQVAQSTCRQPRGYASWSARARTSSTISGGAVCGEPAVNGGSRVVLDPELDPLRPCVVRDLGRERQRHVDPGGDPGSGYDLARTDDPLRNRNCTVRLQQLGLEPVCRPPLARRAGRRRRARASRCRPTSSRSSGRGQADPVEERLVVHERACAEAARDNEHVGLGQIGQRPVGDEGEHPVLRAFRPRHRRDEADASVR